MPPTKRKTKLKVKPRAAGSGLSVSYDQLVQTVLELSKSAQDLREQNLLLLEVARAKVSEARKPIVVLQGSFTREQSETLTGMVRELGGDGVVAVVAPGNTIFSLSDAELHSLGLMRIGLGS